MTRHFTQGKLEEQERQAILEAIYQQAKGAASAAVKAVIEALLEAEVSAKRIEADKRRDGVENHVEVVKLFAELLFLLKSRRACDFADTC